MPPSPWWNVSCWAPVYFTDESGHHRRVTFNRLHINPAGEWLIGAIDLDDGREHWFPLGTMNNVAYNP